MAGRRRIRLEAAERFERLSSGCAVVPADGSRAAQTCYKPGQRSRLINRPRLDDGQGRNKGRKSFAWSKGPRPDRPSAQPARRPIVLVRDNLNTHLAAGRKEFAAAQDWLTANPTMLRG
ncbi:hypothetical protein [Streptomyces sp. TLI_171]|uniref:hypothetical protein n=1 Tax=Streptomyces sp. TLI_171 TaxID=1938859 RepID=UPI00117D347E|nr:hypothetical protein [Streptomyces sp. TLI_171]